MPPHISGLFITLEGGEGSGKSTLAGTLAERLKTHGHSVCLTREPGATHLGSLIQAIFEAGQDPPLSPLAELLLFEADRTQHVDEIVQPALAADQIVVCDRFTDSSLAYQGYGRGLDLNLIRLLNDAGTGGLKPDLTLLLDLPPQAGLARAGAQRDTTGREPLAFHTRVRAGFLALAKEEPDRFVVIDATLEPVEVTKRAMLAVERVQSRRA